MNYLKVMVKQKRVKVLIFSILLFLGFYHIKADRPNIKNYVAQNVSYCVSSEKATQSAIAWIYPSELKVSTDSYFIPQIRNDYGSNFENNLKEDWDIKDWFLSNGSSLGVITDTRWEGFKVSVSDNQFRHTSNASLELEAFPLSFSVLANNSVEILLCEGWNHEEYPGYYINIGTNNSKFVSFDQVNRFDSLYEENKGEITFKSDVNILSSQSWKSFLLNYVESTGYLELIYYNDNKYTTIVKVENSTRPLRPLYFFTRSRHGKAQWKIHKNKYIFTNNSAVTELGPKIKTDSTDICVSLYVSMCDYCSMNIFFYDGTYKELLTHTVKSSNNNKINVWKEIKLLGKHNIADFIQIYVETNYTDQSKEYTQGFWAIDEIRVCAPDEIKISEIVSKENDLKGSDVICQSLNYEKWRPVKQFIEQNIKDVKIEVKELTMQSISFKIISDSALNTIKIYNYKAEGTMQCVSHEVNKLRDKSNSHITTSEDLVLIDHLIPYTFYGVTITDPILNWTKNFNFHTHEAEFLTEEEVPKNVLIKTTENSIEISWDKTNCSLQYGPIVYKINVTNNKLNFYKTLVGTINNYIIENLRSFTNYTVYIITARKAEHIDQNSRLVATNVYNVKTLSGVAPSVNNLEVYSSDKESIDLRFDLPNETNGVPKFINVIYCPQSINCENVITNLETCKLWKDKFCYHLQNLTPQLDYFISVQIKNENTTLFGPESDVKGTAKLTEPAPPNVINYTMVNCEEENFCDLNLTWEHPYYPKSTIEKFEIILLELNDASDFQEFVEIYKVLEYQETYSLIIRYIPFSTYYKVFVLSSNKKFTSKKQGFVIKTDHIGKHINQEPKVLNVTDTRLIFDIPKLDKRLDSYLMIVIVQDNDQTKNVSEDVLFYTGGQVCNTHGDSWIAEVLQVFNQSEYNLTLGNNETFFSTEINKTILNKPLIPGTKYCITFVIQNNHQGNEHLVIYYAKDVLTKSEENPKNLKENSFLTIIGVISFCIIIVIITIIAYFAIRFFSNSRVRNQSEDEHIYMSLESIPQVVNHMYDKLIPS